MENQLFLLFLPDTPDIFLPVLPDIFLPAVIFRLFCVLDKKFSKIEKHKIVSFE